MRKLFAALSIIFLLPLSCNKTKISQKEYFFVCSGKFYDFSQAFELSKMTVLRGGSGFIWLDKAYFVFVSMHKRYEDAKLQLDRMPKGYFVFRLTLPLLENKTFLEILKKLEPLLDEFVYAYDFDQEGFAQKIEFALNECILMMTDGKFLFLKANFVVLKNKIENCEENVKYVQTEIFATLVQFVRQF